MYAKPSTESHNFRSISYIRNFNFRIMEHDKIKEVIEELLRQMAVAFETVEKADTVGSDHTRFLVRTGDSHLLIGSKGENLSALNHVARKLAGKALGQEGPMKFFVDVNDYHEKTLEVLKVKAKMMSERARSFKSDVELEPMSSYERMLVHSFLEGSPEVKTESRGEGASRRVVIKYIS